MRNSGADCPTFNKMYICLSAFNGILIVFLFQLHLPAFFSEFIGIAELSDKFDQN